MALDVKIKELVALGAAVAGNCIPCLEWHYKKCFELNIPIDDVKDTIEIARIVKGVPIKKIDELANNLLQQKAGK